LKLSCDNVDVIERSKSEALDLKLVVESNKASEEADDFSEKETLSDLLEKKKRKITR
jgi:hypothetical protein